MSKVVITDWPEYSCVEKDTLNPVIAATAEQQIFNAGTVLGKITDSGKYTKLNPAATDGSQIAAAVLIKTVVVAANSDSSEGVADFRYARLYKDSLIFPEGITDEQKQTALDELESVGIIATAN